MFKRRRFWAVVGCVLALVVVPLLMYRLWWYPSTPRGAVDRIRMGMTAAEVRAILEPLEDGGKTLSDPIVHAEGWYMKDGEQVHTHCDDARALLGLQMPFLGQAMQRATPLLGFEGPGAKFLNIGGTNLEDLRLDKVTRDGIIVVKFDDRGRVCGKLWLAFPRESVNPLERFWSWLPF